METSYQAVLFNIDKPDDPRVIKIEQLMYDSLKNGWTKELQLKNWIYEVDRCRSFDLVSEIFGVRKYLIIDVKKLRTADKQPG